MRTPWGKADYVKKLDRDGNVVQVSTSGHGGIGIKLKSKYHEKMTAPARLAGIYEAGHYWYEEDCDWAIVAHQFPELFTADDYVEAMRSLHTWNRPYLGMPEVRPFLNEGELYARTAWGDWHETVPEGFVGVILGDGERGNEVTTSGLLPEQDYSIREVRGEGPTSERIVKTANLDTSWNAP